eukprot:c24890_g1_i2 orf=339-2273(-)
MDRHQQFNCRHSDCFSCLMNEPNPVKRQRNLVEFFKDLANDGQASAVVGLWSNAMAHPNEPEFVEVGIFDCMSSLIWKGIKNRRWLLHDRNIFVPYYASHIIGSYTMNREEFAIRAVEEGVIPPLVELLRGRLTWAEQRVAVRALGHIAAYDSTFPMVAAHSEVLELAMELAISSLEIVYTHFIQSEERRLRYHCYLLTRGTGGPDVESQKGEEWASQLQCWSLQLINCFAFKERYLSTICKPGFLIKLQALWGGLVNENSPAGVGLLRTICHHKSGRRSVAACPIVIQMFCNLARSSDDWKFMAVDCLLLLLQDKETRPHVMDMAVVALVDLANLPSVGDRKKLGNLIASTLLQTGTQIRGSSSSKTRQLVEELASQQERIMWERSMANEELLVKQRAALVLKLEGNAKFSAGNIMGAAYKYTEALAICPMGARKERVVLHSNRAQCHLLLQDPEAAISDSTRALCLYRPINCHGKSLWRRAQAYDLMGLAKESLLDAIMFMNECLNGNQPCVPDYVEQLVRKNMQATWLFRDAALRHGFVQRELYASTDFSMEVKDESDDCLDWDSTSESDAAASNEGTSYSSAGVRRENKLHGYEKQDIFQKLIPSLKRLDIKEGEILLPKVKDECPQGQPKKGKNQYFLA